MPSRERRAARRSQETRRFYDRYPYDTASWQVVLSQGDRARHRHQGIRLIPRLHAEGLATPRVVDVGCGVGWLLQAYRIAWGVSAPLVGIDLSVTALRHARRVGLPVALADNLALPLPDAWADVVLSCGVVHHTADAQRAFRENVRVLRQRGWMVLHVYNRDDLYPWLYWGLGAPLRLCVRWGRGVGDAICRWLVLPLFYVAGSLRSWWVTGRGWTKSRQQAWNHFADFFLAPASFFTKRAILQWVAEEGMDVVEYERALGAHCLVLRKH